MQSGQTKSLRISSLPVLAHALLLAAYWVFRYAGNAMEGDATRLALAAQGVYDEGTLVPSQQAYQSGYNYPALLAILTTFTGVSIQDIQLSSRFRLVVIAFTAFTCYREVPDSSLRAHLQRTAAAGTVGSTRFRHHPSAHVIYLWCRVGMGGVQLAFHPIRDNLSQ